MARVLRAGEVFDDLLESLEEGKMTGEDVLEQLEKQRGTVLDPAVADILLAIARAPDSASPF